MSNAKIMQDFIKECCPDKLNKDWVLWAFHYVIQADSDGEKISPHFLSMSMIGDSTIMKSDPVMLHFNCPKEDIEPEME